MSSEENDGTLNSVIGPVQLPVHSTISVWLEISIFPGSGGLKLTLALWKAILYIDIIEECFRYQHTNGPTRCRGDYMSSQLDHIFTNELEMVSDVQHTAPLGRSDNQMLMFNINCYADCTGTQQRFNYNRVTMKMEGMSYMKSLSQPMVVCSRCGILLMIELLDYVMITCLLSILENGSGSQTICMTKRCWICLERRPYVIGSGWLGSMVLKDGEFTSII